MATKKKAPAPKMPMHKMPGGYAMPGMPMKAAKKMPMKKGK